MKKSFFLLYIKFIFKEPMITPIRGDAKLDNPPKEYENKDVEAGNFMIKC